MTKCEATAGEAALELNVAVVPGFVIVDAMPNSATSEYHYAFVKVSKFEEWGEELAIFNLLRDNAPICGDDFWQLDIAYFEEGVINVDEVAAESYSIFPNPAKDFVKVSTDNSEDLKYSWNVSIDAACHVRNK